MESALCKSIFAQGKARGVAQGVAQARAGTIHKVLVRWLGSVDASVRARLETFPNRDLVAMWHDEALELNDVAGARKLLETILQTPVPPPAEGSSEAA